MPLTPIPAGLSMSIRLRSGAEQARHAGQARQKITKK
jgi:hypothetical protein